MRTQRITLTLALAAAFLVPLRAQDLEVELQRAIQKETVTGDLTAAIEEYSRIRARAGSNRAVAAKAMLRLAECYQKLGNAKSREIYELVVAEYADQKQAVGMAHAALGRTRIAAGKEMSNRRVWTLPLQGLIYGTVSHDGRYVPYTDWGRYGDLFVHDLVTGVDRQITNTGTDGKPGVVGQHAEQCTFSRDGNQLVYAWDKGDPARYELRIVDLRGNGIPQFRRLFDNEDVFWISPDDWSPDGKWLAVQIKRKDKTKQIGLVSVQDGSLRVLRSVDWRGSSKVYFSPDGKYVAYDLPQSDGSPRRDVFILSIDGTRQIPAVVHSGHDLITGWSPDGKWLLFASDRFGSMGLWGLPFTQGKAQGEPELIKADIGGLDSRGITNSGALFSQVDPPSGISVAKIQLGAIDFATGTFLSSPGELTQGYLESNSGPSWSADGKYLAYLSVRPSGNRGTLLVVVIRSAETRQVVRELQVNAGTGKPAAGQLSVVFAVTWAPDGRSLMTRGVDLIGRWGIYQIDAQTGEASALRLDQPGETIARYPKWSRDGKSIYFGRNLPGGKGIAFVQWDLASGNEKELVRRAWLGVPNVSPDGRYIATPSVDPSTNSRVVLLIPTAGGEPREMMKVPSGVEPAELTNNSKGDVVGAGAIWAPDSTSFLAWKTTRPAAGKPNNEVWQVPINGDEPRKLDMKFDPPGGGTGQHPDGRQIAYSVVVSDTRPSQPSEIWMLENFLPVASAKK